MFVACIHLVSALLSSLHRLARRSVLGVACPGEVNQDKENPPKKKGYHLVSKINPYKESHIPIRLTVMNAQE